MGSNMELRIREAQGLPYHELVNEMKLELYEPLAESKGSLLTCEAGLDHLRQPLENHQKHHQPQEGSEALQRQLQKMDQALRQENQEKLRMIDLHLQDKSLLLGKIQELESPRDMEGLLEGLLPEHHKCNNLPL